VNPWLIGHRISIRDSQRSNERRCISKPGTSNLFFALGGNEEAAPAAGINVDRIIWFAFFFAGLLSGLAGILMTGRLDSAIITQGQGAILAVVSGMLLIGVINSRLTLAEVPSFYVQASTSAVIIIAEILIILASRRSSGMKTRTQIALARLQSTSST
jgi:simple sugar transport system permease protein